MRTLCCVFVVVVLCSVWFGVADATTLIPMDTRALTKTADVIVLGKVKSSESRWNERRTLIFTYHEVEVTGNFKGKTTERITIKQLGGVVRPFAQVVPGMPAFSAGEEVFGFLSKHADGTHGVVGLSQGKFRVVTDKKTGEKLLKHGPSVDGTALHFIGGHQEKSGEEDVPKGMLLDDYVEEIRSILSEGGR